ncbi:MAG: response regulator transcription factor [Oleiphilaceae bacterium]|nr:response regulator transcription factor [Oleiphilaceae bacterium]
METQVTRILVIDDHPFFLDGLKLGLEGCTHNGQQRFLLDTAISPLDAFKMLSHAGAYDLILCDLHLPEMSGIAFIQRLLKQDLWIPVVTISASENIADIDCALAAGAAGFINKSLSKTELLAALQQVLLGHQYVPPNYRSFYQRGEPARDTCAQNAEKLGITRKQFKVLTYMGQGLSNREISERMSVTINTVKSHTKALFQILDVKNRTACILIAKKHKLLPESFLVAE